VVATSEAETSPLLLAVRQLGVAAVLKKPWKPDALAGAIEQAVRNASAREEHR
jgi:UDP:flavonoid glycosyltransferase YjiC (YdhE family)